MPRSSRSGGSSRSAPSGSRGAHTMAAPPQQHQQQYQQPPQQYAQQQPAMAQQTRSPGLFGQMASTAAGVAVGSTVGHGLSNMLFGGSGSAPAEQHQQAPPQAYDQSAYASQQQNIGVSCEQQSKDFIKCLESTNDMNSCSYYLEQLKACQAAARPY
ncbi:related to MIC17 - mitochondrial intermembrane space protein, required for normal oxygen consumption [Melanopsichium pennsylvanicum]|uniref:Related to MIC17 - mitochondrial intermembrane space protein, required for normal oxygen consumption n=2 Tax=Melanopsichium pennsylvanicum TaxID=63383 RepID=A0AAJ4XG51_9BASI|nr:conserved hypothetical protein [Melanopsichium pennsylvanicum 4]SNX81879.1 related to MIC17 - mitochondrial intermembrane space protein, required for normal oxygen consumption [Melanopsichium pennsylvanicum]